MPHRCGIFHVRGSLPSGGDKQKPTVAKREVNEYLKVCASILVNE